MKTTRSIAGGFASSITVAILSAGLFVQSSPAQIRFSAGSPYVQDFNSLTNAGIANPWTNNSTLPGWYASQTGAGGALTNYRTGSGSSTAGGLYSFGASGSTDRALGSLASSAPGRLAYGVRFLNDTALAITNLMFTYTGEQWRCANPDTQALTFSYFIDDGAIAGSDAQNLRPWIAFTNLDFISPTTGTNTTSLDGTASTNRHLFANIVLPGVAVQPGEEIFFRWYDADDLGADHALAIDNVAIAFASTTPGAVRIAKWDFNATNKYPATMPEPCLGSGNAGLVGGVSGEFAGGAPADPAEWLGTDNSAWGTASYPRQGTTNKQAGVLFRLSTAGYRDLSVTWEQRNSPSACKYLRFQYSTDGTTFTDGPALVMHSTNTFDAFSVALSAAPAANDNSNFVFRLVSEFESTALGTTNDNYTATGIGSSYSTAGTIRFDLVTVFGSPISAVTFKPLTIRLMANQAVLTWTNRALTLQSATAVGGAFADVAGATSPYTNSLSGGQKFFKLRP